MKLRLEDNTLRLRLSEPEVREFAATGRVAGSTNFGVGPGQQLRYALERTPAGTTENASAETVIPESIALRYTPGTITVLVPAALANDWTGTARNGFDGEIRVAENQRLRILVEKDLDCRH